MEDAAEQTCDRVWRTAIIGSSNERQVTKDSDVTQNQYRVEQFSVLCNLLTPTLIYIDFYRTGVYRFKSCILLLWKP